MVFAAFRQFNHLNLIFDSISDMVFLISVEEGNRFCYVNANKAAIDHVKLPKDFIGKTIEEIMPKESASIIVSKYAEAIQLKTNVSYVAKLYICNDSDKKKMEKKYFESRVTPIFDEDGICTHIVAITNDITESKRREQEIKREKVKFELVFNHAADAIFTFNEDGNFKMVNPGFTELLGWTEAEIERDPTITMIPPEYQNDYLGIFERLKQGETIKNHQAKRVTKDGRLIDVLSSYTPIMDDGEFIGGVALYKDITNIKRISEQLKESEQRYRIIAEYSSDHIRVIDKEGTTLYASPSYKEFGVKPEFYLNKSFLAFANGEDMPILQQFINEIVETKEQQSVEFRRLQKDGDLVWMEAKGAPVLDVRGNVEQIVVVSRDIDRQKEREEAYKRQANHDALTNLPNRRLFEEKLDEMMSDSRRLKRKSAVLILDCDRFKFINDTYGHDVGDEVLKTFADRISGLIGADDIVSRVGGDEFMILFSQIESDQMLTVLASQIVASIKESINIGELELSLTTSIGIAIYNGDGKERGALLKEADDALYEVKKSGRNGFKVYSAEKKGKLSYIELLFKLKDKLSS